MDFERILNDLRAAVATLREQVTGPGPREDKQMTVANLERAERQPRRCRRAGDRR